MGTYRQEYTVLANAIVTNAIVVPTDAEVRAGEQPSLYYYTDSAAWDTGAQFTLISPRVVEALGLKPSGKGHYMGIGGDQESDTFFVHIGLPNGQLKRYVNAYCADLDDYDILLGMDIITQTDFLITNADGKTTFQFRTPSEGGVEL
jgi:predicted aspartyl protease